MRIGAAAVVLAAALAAAGCGSSSKTAAPAQTTTATAAKPKAAPAATAPSSDGTAAAGKCVPVPGSLLHRIESGMILDGAKLHDAQAVASPAIPDLWFVTARVKGGGAGDKLATWAANGLTGKGQIYALDSFAALISSFGSAVSKSVTLTTHTPAAYRSRVCVAGPGAPRGLTAPFGGGKPAPIGQ
jgi:hypothetical protein